MKHCLVVDDSAVIRKVARRILDGIGARTTEAEDGEGATLACRSEMPDAILLDATIPGTDGFAFLRELRQMPGGEAPRVLFCLVENDVAQITRALRAGATSYLLKPFDKATVLAKLEEVGFA